MQDRHEKPAEAPRAYELTAFELALVSGGTGCPSTAYARTNDRNTSDRLAAKPPVGAKF